eukprot:13592498-Ditylum_brightwellii.AAC.1
MLYSSHSVGELLRKRSTTNAQGRGEEDDIKGQMVHQEDFLPLLERKRTKKYTIYCLSSSGKLSPNTLRLAQFLAGSITHSQGLIYLWRANCTANMILHAFIGSGLEGFLVIDLIWVLLSGEYIWGKVLALMLSVISNGCIHTSVIFMKKNGSDELPDMWVILEGIQNVKSYAMSELLNDPSDVVWSIILCMISTVPAAMLVFTMVMRNQANEQVNQLEQKHSNLKQEWKRAYFIRSMFLIASIVLYCTGAWMPIFHAYASSMGSLIFSPPGFSTTVALEETKRKSVSSVSPTAPNIVLIIHESLSGEHTLANKSCLQLMPFVKQMLYSKDEHFVFENVRSVSGDTCDALTAIQSGCLPLDHKEGREMALNTTLATQFKSRGYDTVSFSSSALNMAGTKWFMTQNQLSANFDEEFNPLVTKDLHVNEAAQDDILVGNYFKEWLNLRQKDRSNNEGDGRKPFFAQFYYVNSHYPFRNNQNISKTESRIDGMFATVDKSIENIYEHLREAGELNNTIVIGSGDHGENLDGRISEQHTKMVENLRYNTHQLVSTLDLFPTLMQLADGISSQNNYPKTNGHCVRGYNLLTTRITSDRVAWSFPGVISDFSSLGRGSMAVHYGTSSLLGRFGWPRGNRLRVLKYGDVIGSSSNETKELTFEEWKIVMQNITGSCEEAVLARNTSALLTSFMEVLNGK